MLEIFQKGHSLVFQSIKGKEGEILSVFQDFVNVTLQYNNRCSTPGCASCLDYFWHFLFGISLKK